MDASIRRTAFVRVEVRLDTPSYIGVVMSRPKIRYRCTECNVTYSLPNQAARCHWGTSGVEEVKPEEEVGNTTEGGMILP